MNVYGNQNLEWFHASSLVSVGSMTLNFNDDMTKIQFDNLQTVRGHMQFYSNDNLKYIELNEVTGLFCDKGFMILTVMAEITYLSNSTPT